MAVSAMRFIAPTTEDLRIKLRQAWNDFKTSSADQNSLLDVLNARRDDADSRTGDNIASSSSNGHSSSDFMPGENSYTGREEVRLWANLVERYEQAAAYLRTCCKLGVDAFVTRQNASVPINNAALPADQRLMLDTTGNWDFLCDLRGIPSADVIGKVVGDKAIYLWMLDTLIEVREQRSDFSSAIIGRGGMQYT